MTRKVLFITLLSAGLICAALTLRFAPVVAAQSSPAPKKAPPTSVTEGRKLFLQYCASCHGADAKGRGPVASHLKTWPADLTQIPLENGKFPDYKIKELISGEAAESVHGTREMPVWGSIMRRKGGEGLLKLELYNLSKYLESIQQK